MTLKAKDGHHRCPKHEVGCLSARVWLGTNDSGDNVTNLLHLEAAEVSNVGGAWCMSCVSRGFARARILIFDLLARPTVGGSTRVECVEARWAGSLDQPEIP